ncbi:MAG: metallophosphoesterase [Phycisphaeraceae bacterium]
MPRIGLLSDSHGRAVTTRRAVELLVQAGVDLLIHLGDVGTVEVIDELAVQQPDSRAPIPARLVFGNTDWDIVALSEYARFLGVTVDHPVGELALEQGELVFCHGHESAVMNQALGRGVRYLCHGHTHQAADQRQGHTRVINPGALCRAHRYTVAVLNTDTDQLDFIQVPAR